MPGWLRALSLQSVYKLWNAGNESDLRTRSERDGQVQHTDDLAPNRGLR